MDAERRRHALAAFLREHRERLRPEDFGFPSRDGGRRGSGLRRDEIAELAGVSSKWYALFEAGSVNRHFSQQFVQRVADVLSLNETERATLYELVLPEIIEPIARLERSKANGSMQAVHEIAAFSNDVGDATSLGEIVHLGARAVQGALMPDCLTVATLVVDVEGPELVFGPRARFFGACNRHAVLGAQIPPRAVAICETIPLVEEIAGDVAEARIEERVRGGSHERSRQYTRLLEHWSEQNGRLRARSSMTIPLSQGGRCRGFLTLAWLERREFSPLEVEVLETTAAIIELAIR